MLVDVTCRIDTLGVRTWNRIARIGGTPVAARGAYVRNDGRICRAAASSVRPARIVPRRVRRTSDARRAHVINDGSICRAAASSVLFSPHRA